MRFYDAFRLRKRNYLHKIRNFTLIPALTPTLMPIALQLLNEQRALAACVYPLVEADVGEDVGLVEVGGAEVVRIIRTRRQPQQQFPVVLPTGEGEGGPFGTALVLGVPRHARLFGLQFVNLVAQFEKPILQFCVLANPLGVIVVLVHRAGHALALFDQRQPFALDLQMARAFLDAGAITPQHRLFNRNAILAHERQHVFARHLAVLRRQPILKPDPLQLFFLDARRFRDRRPPLRARGALRRRLLQNPLDGGNIDRRWRIVLIVVKFRALGCDRRASAAQDRERLASGSGAFNDAGNDGAIERQAFGNFACANAVSPHSDDL